ncbi:Cyclic nucleotide-binding protein [Pseudocohnilembus persalinus]|uniref:Cyclic nucleotide-binding protein n=1 Tax=Pseudocohnilembus persalinus TaxID=266149 RepID=A0A0V0QNY9_PSEPJ|nr:Cyclic nucleotide-binding protein [Pseudocohnilembus persalinus]|eukprot:KRX04099.1 Cyclic nucleotide-binding protein [Pseudocohnilembus persalinus]
MDTSKLKLKQKRMSYIDNQSQKQYIINNESQKQNKINNDSQIEIDQKNLNKLENIKQGRFNHKQQSNYQSEIVSQSEEDDYFDSEKVQDDRKYLENLRDKQQKMEQNTYEKELMCLNYDVLGDKATHFSLDSDKQNWVDKIEQNLEKISDHIPVFNPESFWILMIDFVVILYFTYQILLLPLRFAFNDGEINNQFFDIVILSSFIQGVHVLVCMNTGIYYEGQITYSRQLILQKYFRTQLWIDLFSLVAVFIDNNYFSCIYLLQLKHLKNTIYAIDEHFQIQQKFFTVYSLVNLVLLTFFVAHYCACGFLVLSLIDGNQKGWMWASGIEEAEWQIKYLNALYFMLITMSTIGYGDISPVTNVEKIYGMAVTLMACGVFAFCVNMIGSMFQEKAQASMEYKQLDSGQLIQKQINDNLINIQINIQKKGQDVLQQISHQISQEVYKEYYTQILFQSEVLNQYFSKEFILQLSLIMKEKSLLPGELLYSQKSLDNSLYYLAKGELEVFEYHPKLTVISSIKEIYCVLCEQYRNNPLSQEITKICQICQKRTHPTSSCPLTYYQPNIQKLVFKYNKDCTQQRQRFFRGGNKNKINEGQIWEWLEKALTVRCNIVLSLIQDPEYMESINDLLDVIDVHDNESFLSLMPSISIVQNEDQTNKLFVQPFEQFCQDIEVFNQQEEEDESDLNENSCDQFINGSTSMQNQINQENDCIGQIQQNIDGSLHSMNSPGSKFAKQTINQFQLNIPNSGNLINSTCNNQEGGPNGSQFSKNKEDSQSCFRNQTGKNLTYQSNNNNSIDQRNSDRKKISDFDCQNNSNQFIQQEPVDIQNSQINEQNLENKELLIQSPYKNRAKKTLIKRKSKNGRVKSKRQLTLIGAYLIKDHKSIMQKLCKKFDEQDYKLNFKDQNNQNNDQEMKNQNIKNKGSIIRQQSRFMSKKSEGIRANKEFFKMISMKSRQLLQNNISNNRNNNNQKQSSQMHINQEGSQNYYQNLYQNQNYYQNYNNPSQLQSVKQKRRQKQESTGNLGSSVKLNSIPYYNNNNNNNNNQIQKSQFRRYQRGTVNSGGRVQKGHFGSVENGLQIFQNQDFVIEQELEGFESFYDLENLDVAKEYVFYRFALEQLEGSGRGYGQKQIESLEKVERKNYQLEGARGENLEGQLQQREQSQQ